MSQTRIEVSIVCVLNDDGKLCSENGTNEVFTEMLKNLQDLSLSDSEYGKCSVHVGLEGEDDPRFSRSFSYPSSSIN